MDPNHPSPEYATACSAIVRILHRYGSLARDKVDWAKFQEIFTDDATFRLVTGVAIPAKDIFKVVRGKEAQYIRHHVTTMDFSFDDNNSAHGETQFIGYTDVATPDHWGCWRDIFHRQPDGRWLIYDRTVVVEGSHPDGWYARTYPEMK